jgi:anti-sigma-K factor RskA
VPAVSSNAIDIHALAGAYALDALTDIERAAFARHMGSCVACELEVAELAETAARLSGPLAEAPPPRLRESVLAEISRTPQERSARSHREPRGGAAARWRRWTAAAVAAGIIAAGAGAATWIVENQRVREQRAQLAAVTDVLKAPDVQVRQLNMQRGGRVTVVVSPSRDAGVVVLSDLPRQSVDKAYELWLLADGSPARQQGLLAPGQTSATVRIGPLRDAKEFGLSVEPASGSQVPTDVFDKLPLH